MNFAGTPLDLYTHAAAKSISCRNFESFSQPKLDSVYLPETLSSLMSENSTGVKHFIEDDNRGAILPGVAATIDGVDFYLSVKGVGSTTDPFSFSRLDKTNVSNIVADSRLSERIRSMRSESARFITGELWLRGSPYGGQGLEHAATALNISEMADVTSINGFNIAPVVKIVFLPEELQHDIKQIFWYRRYGGSIVQELRLVPSSIRVYFHSGSAIGRNIRNVFDMFGISSNEKAYDFEINLIRSCIAMLTLFPRTLEWKEDGRYAGLDFNDVWLDKDAVVSPDGTVYFVDLEGIEKTSVGEAGVQDKIDEQIFRSLYEFMFAYEQIEHERSTRFGKSYDRKTQFEILLREALKDDSFIDLSKSGGSLKLIVRNKLSEERLNKVFPILDRDVV